MIAIGWAEDDTGRRTFAGRAADEALAAYLCTSPPPSEVQKRLEHGIRLLPSDPTALSPLQVAKDMLKRHKEDAIDGFSPFIQALARERIRDTEDVITLIQSRLAEATQIYQQITEGGRPDQLPSDALVLLSNLGKLEEVLTPDTIRTAPEYWLALMDALPAPLKREYSRYYRDCAAAVISEASWVDTIAQADATTHKGRA